MTINKEVYKLNDTFNLIMNVQDEDKKRVKEALSWTESQIKYSIKERFMDNLIIKEGDIWTCDLGVNVGSEINKTRPVVIIQAKGSKECKTVLIAPISTSGTQVPGHININQNDIVYRDSNGSISGAIKTEQIRAVSKARLGRFIGNLLEIKRIELKQQLSCILGLTEKTIQDKQISIIN